MFKIESDFAQHKTESPQFNSELDVSPISKRCEASFESTMNTDLQTPQLSDASTQIMNTEPHYTQTCKPVSFESLYKAEVKIKNYQTKDNEGCPFCGSVCSLVTHTCEQYQYLMSRLYFKKRIYKGDDILPILFPKLTVKKLKPPTARVILKQLYFINHIKAKRIFCNCKNEKIFVEYNKQDHDKVCFQYKKNEAVAPKFQCLYCHKLVTLTLESDMMLLDKHRCRERIIDILGSGRNFKTMTRKAYEIPFDIYWNATNVSDLKTPTSKLPHMLYPYTKKFTLLRIKKHIQTKSPNICLEKVNLLTELKFLEWESNGQTIHQCVQQFPEWETYLKSYQVEPCYFKIGNPKGIDQLERFQRSRKALNSKKIHENSSVIRIELPQSPTLAPIKPTMLPVNIYNIRKLQAKNVWQNEIFPLLTRCKEIISTSSYSFFNQDDVSIVSLVSQSIDTYLTYLFSGKKYTASNQTFTTLIPWLTDQLGVESIDESIMKTFVEDPTLGIDFYTTFKALMQRQLFKCKPANQTITLASIVESPTQDIFNQLN